RYVLLGLCLLDGVAALVVVGGAVDGNADLLAVTLHGRARGADAFGLVQVVGQLLVGPVGPVQPLLGRPLDDPAFDLVGQAGGALAGLAWGLGRAQAVEPTIQVGVEPALHRTRGYSQVRGYLLVGPVAARQPDYLHAVSVLRISLFPVGQFEPLRLPLGESDAYHFLSSLSFFPPSLYPSDNLTGHVYQSEKFYRDDCQMVCCGPDPNYHNLPYYEMTRDIATRFTSNSSGGEP